MTNVCRVVERGIRLPLLRPGGMYQQPTTEGEHMTMTTTDPERVKRRDSYFETVAELEAVTGRMRAKADRLVSEDGSVEARREAKSIRIKATHEERWVAHWLSYLGTTEEYVRWCEAQEVSA